PGRSQAAVKCDELGVPSERSGQCCGVQAMAQSFTASCDMACANALAAVVIVRGKPGQCGHLFAAEAAGLGQADQEGGCGAQSDAVDAGDQIEPIAQVTMSADGREQLLELVAKKPAESPDLILPELPYLRRAAALAVVLAAGDLIGDLID